jgi:hypothetical protein
VSENGPPANTRAARRLVAMLCRTGGGVALDVERDRILLARPAMFKYMSILTIESIERYELRGQSPLY